jgi:hypothetical protein
MNGNAAPLATAEAIGWVSDFCHAYRRREGNGLFVKSKPNVMFSKPCFPLFRKIYSGHFINPPGLWFSAPHRAA